MSIGGVNVPDAFDRLYNDIGAPGVGRNRATEFDKKKTPVPSPPDETQDEEITREITVLINGKRYALTDDGDLDIRNKLTGMGISIQQNGDIMMLTGSGGNGKACGGRFMINAKGGQITKAGGPIITEATADPKSPVNGEGSQTSGGAGKDEIACSNLYYGDAITECHGELRIRATKVTIEAADVLSLIGKEKVMIQAGPSGGGEIQFNAGTIKENASIKETTITGQKLDIGSAEETTLQFDPRASKNLVSSGHLNVKVLGDRKENIGGLSHTVVLGNAINIPLIKNRSSGLVFDVQAGNANLSTKVGSLLFAVGGVSFPDSFAPGGISLTAAKDIGLDAALKVDAKAAGMDFNAGPDGISLISAGGDITIAGALIYLN